MKQTLRRFNRQNIRRLVIMLLALATVSIGICFFSIAGFGTDPFTCMNQGLSRVVGHSFGITQLFVNLALLVAVFFCGRYLIGIATLANMVLIGFLVDLFLPGFQRLSPAQPGLPLRILFMLLGVVVASLGTSLYSQTKLGVSPYDAAGLIISQKSGLKYMWCRMITDAITTSVGFFSGSIVGVGTLITVFFMGPLISWSNEYICNRLLHMDEFENPLLADTMLHRNTPSA